MNLAAVISTLIALVFVVGCFYLVNNLIDEGSPIITTYNRFAFWLLIVAAPGIAVLLAQPTAWLLAVAMFALCPTGVLIISLFSFYGFGLCKAQSTKNWIREMDKFKRRSETVCLALVASVSVQLLFMSLDGRTYQAILAVVMAILGGLYSLRVLARYFNRMIINGNSIIN